LIFEHKQLLHAIYNQLFSFCETIGSGKRINERRDNELEKKTAEVFRKFFPKDAVFYSSSFVDGKEKDLIIAYKKRLFVIESKAGKRHEPLFNPNKGAVRLKQEFSKTIGDGYEQCYCVRKKFIYGEMLSLCDQYGVPIHEINLSRYHECYSIIITNDRFGPLQTDLELLLEIKEGDVYPWSIRIDDLEVFLLAMQKKNLKINDFILFLNQRRSAQGVLYSDDESYICGMFILKKKLIIPNRETEEGYVSPNFLDVFDKMYTTGLGFVNERNLIQKRDPLYYKI
jgi:hypothetical protein